MKSLSPSDDLIRKLKLQNSKLSQVSVQKQAVQLFCGTSSTFIKCALGFIIGVSLSAQQCLEI